MTVKPETSARPSDASVASAMKNLENDIRELMHMSDIAANTFDDVGMKIADDSGSVTYRYTHHAIDQFAFLINNVASRAALLERRFSAAYHGEKSE